MWVIERVANMPRSHKFTVGDKLVECCLEVTTLLCEVTYLRDKEMLLSAASRALTRSRLLVRIGERIRLLSASQRDYFAKKSHELGRMLGVGTKHRIERRKIGIGSDLRGQRANGESMRQHHRGKQIIPWKVKVDGFCHRGSLKEDIPEPFPRHWREWIQQPSQNSMVPGGEKSVNVEIKDMAVRSKPIGGSSQATMGSNVC